MKRSEMIKYMTGWLSTHYEPVEGYNKAVAEAITNWLEVKLPEIEWEPDNDQE